MRYNGTGRPAPVEAFGIEVPYAQSTGILFLHFLNGRLKNLHYTVASPTFDCPPECTHLRWRHSSHHHAGYVVQTAHRYEPNLNEANPNLLIQPLCVTSGIKNRILQRVALLTISKSCREEISVYPPTLRDGLWSNFPTDDCSVLREAIQPAHAERTSGQQPGGRIDQRTG